MSIPGRVALATFESLIRDAFEGDPEMSLLANLRDLRDEDWTALPPTANRTIADIVEHVAWAKWMYEDYAFGPATLRGDTPLLTPPHGARSRPPRELLEWLKQGHAKWFAAIRALPDDSELAKPRLTNWGDMLDTQTILRIMLNHDVYHAGEINHLRALLHQTDKWPYE